MKKLLLLLMTMLLCIGNEAWAEEQTIFSADVTTESTISFKASSTTEISSEWATISGGTMYAFNEQTSDKDLIKKQGTGAFCFTNNNTFFKIELDQPLQAGDVINCKTQTRTDTEMGVWVSIETSRPSTPEASLSVDKASSQTWVSLPAFTIPEGNALIDATTIYLYRSVGKTVYFDEFTITRPDNRTKATLTYSASKATAIIGETFTAPTLTIDPTAATDEVTYSSSESTVATISTNGAVSILSAGTTVITATISNSITYQDATASYTLTVRDPNETPSVTATWPFNLGTEGQRAALSTEDAFSGDAVAVSKMGYNGTQTWSEVTGTKVRPTVKATSASDEYVQFSLTPKKGITFTPTSISFDAIRIGTNGGNMDIVAKGKTSSTLATGVTPNRNNEGNEWSHYEYEIENVEADKTNPFSLTLYIYNLDTSKDFCIANVNVEGIYTGVAEDEILYTVTTDVSPAGAGSVTQTPAGESLAEGTAISFSATANTGYRFLNKWTVNGTDVDGETYSIASLSQDTEVTAQFKKLYTVTYEVNDGDKGTTPNALPTEYVESTLILPAHNYYVSKPGYTATGWTDGTNTYAFGQTIDVTDDITLSLVFEANTVSLTETERKNEVSAVWDFTGTPVINVEKATGYFVTQAVIGETSIDIPMFIDNAQKGKVNNVNRTNAQINENTTLSIPAMSGMKVIIVSASGNISSTTVGGEAPSSGSGTKTATYIYTGTDETVNIVFGNDGKYYTRITAVYPATAIDVALNKYGLSTFYYSNSAYSVPNGATASVISSVNGSSMTEETLGNVIPAGCAVILKGEPNTTYTFVKTANETSTLTNLLRGSDVEALTTGETSDGSYLFYALSALNGVVGFYWLEDDGGAFTCAAHKAYLAVDSSLSSASFFSFDNSNGISDIMPDNNVMDAPVYNLSGQRVNANYQGVVIINGVKIMRK